MIFLKTVIIYSLCFYFVRAEECLPRDFGRGSFVCVCTNERCDTLQSIDTPPSNSIVKVTSEVSKKRWLVEKAELQEKKIVQELDQYDLILNVRRDLEYQSILGFGGAFTDATGINLQFLSEEFQQKILEGYYGKDGLEYNLGRVPIGGTDFSNHPYTYDDLPPGQTDPDLRFFNLRQEDHNLKIPMIKAAKEISRKSGQHLSLFSSPWGGPGWMKDNGKINGKGKLLKKFYSTWATYIVKFFQEYSKEGIEFFGLTAQNEPTEGLYNEYAFNAMGWLPEDQGEWISNDLGPQMHKNGFGNITIFIGDDVRILLPDWPQKILAVQNASSYVGGIAIHWYSDYLASPDKLDETHKYFPDLPLLYTESCNGWAPWHIDKVILGSWDRAEEYARDIIENLNHWVTGWTDWNLALNMEGGPNWVKNFVDSPIIVNKATQEVYRQPMFYALAHFSKILPKGSIRMNVNNEAKEIPDVFYVAFLRPDQSMAVIILNRNYSPVKGSLKDSGKGFDMVLEPRSITSFVWTL